MSIEYYAVPKNAVKVSKIKADVKAGVFKGMKTGKLEGGIGGIWVEDSEGNSIAVGNWGNVLTFAVYAGSGQGELILAKLMKHYKFKVKQEETDDDNGEYEFGTEEVEGIYDPVTGVGDGKANAVPVAFSDAFKGKGSCGCGTWRKKKKKCSTKVGKIR